MGKMADIKLVAGVIQMLLIRYDSCECLGPLDACLHCELRMAQDALERLMVADRSGREATWSHVRAYQSRLARQG